MRYGTTALDLFDQIADISRDQDEPWRMKAMCRDLNTESFFPPPTDQGHGSKKRLAEHFKLAASACACCPVIAQCQAKVDLHDPDGFWAGEWSGDRRRRETATMHAAGRVVA